MSLLDDIKRKVFEGEELYSIPGEISEVNESKRTVVFKPLDGGPDILGVRLQATENNADGLVVIPKVGSFGIVTFITPEEAYLSAVDIADKLLIKTSGGVEIEVADKVKINGGGVSLLSSIETILDLLKSKYIVTTPSGPTGAPIASSLTEIEKIRTDLKKLLE